MSEARSSADGPKVVALGGGHGLAASLSALRRITTDLTAVVTVADDGGSSGRLRRELGVLPPGDLRMALAALCDDDQWGQTWSRVVQHRFQRAGDLQGHSVGNLLIVALWEIVDADPVAGLDWVARLLKAQGRVLPMSTVPLDITAAVRCEPAGPLREVRGQVAIATTSGEIEQVGLDPAQPPACPQAVHAVEAAAWVVLGPGSWFTSVIPHLLVPELAAAIVTSSARRCVVLNLDPQPGETAGYAPAAHLEVLRKVSPDLRVDVVIADESVGDSPALREAAADLGAAVLLVPVREAPGVPRHAPQALASAFETAFSTSATG
ncbi:MAG TPA: uridine diphosphate-N-acetylglucosamine-binding protein YvcK [Actinomycetes bacterium]|nr:uridine diphosphate-N-acetylglucosamine-binding protein YvcK [Actinomycetes bacterium]